MAKTINPVKAWTKPELTKLGTIGDVAGNKAINFNGVSGNNADPAPS